MTVLGHVEALKLKEAQVEKLISSELKRPLPDDFLLHTLKSKRLKLKEEMYRFGYEEEE